MMEQPQIKSELNFFFRDKLIIICLVITFVTNLIIWLVLYYKIKPNPEPIPLHYNIYFGIDLIGQWYKIYFIPGFGFLIFFINLLLSSIIYKREKIISYFLVLATCIAQIVLLGASLLIIQQSV